MPAVCFDLEQPGVEQLAQVAARGSRAHPGFGGEAARRQRPTVVEGQHHPATAGVGQHGPDAAEVGVAEDRSWLVRISHGSPGRFDRRRSAAAYRGERSMGTVTSRRSRPARPCRGQARLRRRAVGRERCQRGHRADSCRPGRQCQRASVGGQRVHRRLRRMILYCGRARRPDRRQARFRRRLRRVHRGVRGVRPRPAPRVLVASRAVQGVGAAALVPCSLSVAQPRFSGAGGPGPRGRSLGSRSQPRSVRRPAGRRGAHRSTLGWRGSSSSTLPHRRARHRAHPAPRDRDVAHSAGASTCPDSSLVVIALALLAAAMIEGGQRGFADSSVLGGLAAAASAGRRFRGRGVRGVPRRCCPCPCSGPGRSLRQPRSACW